MCGEDAACRTFGQGTAREKREIHGEEAQFPQREEEETPLHIPWVGQLWPQCIASWGVDPWGVECRFLNGSPRG